MTHTALESYWERIAVLYEQGRFANLLRRYGEDAVHTAIVRVADRIRRNPERFDELRSTIGIVGWYSRNVSVDAHRHWTNRTGELSPALVARVDVADEAAAAVELNAVMDRMATLAPQHQVMLAYAVSEATHREIADETGLSLSAIKSRMHRARENVREAVA